MLSALLVLLPSGSSAFVGGVSRVPAAPASVGLARPALAARSPLDVSMGVKDRGIPLTGQTLAASLKLRCDTSGADYALFWSPVGDKLKVTGAHIASGSTAKYVEASKAVQLDLNGDGPVATVKRSQEPFWVPEAATSTVLKRRELARQGGINQIAFVPFEGGVVEFGNAKRSVTWAGIPDAPTIPKKELRKAFEELGALYALYWELDGDKFRVAGEYENPRDKKTRMQLRGDGKSFPSLSTEYELSATGDGPIATALNNNEEVVVTFADGCEFTSCASMKRAERAREFSICSIHAVPIVDADGRKRGVLEYGVNSNKVFNDLPMEATLKMQAEGSGAAYAIYWSQDGTSAKAKKTYVTAQYRALMDKAGKKLSFPEVSEGNTFELAGESPVARAMRTRKPIYISDIKAETTDARANIADEYLIDQVAFFPVLGGVMEYGTTRGTGVWNGPDEALIQLIPNEPIEEAFAGGATYAIYWQRDEDKGVYEVAASYEIPKNRLSKAQSDNSYIAASAKLSLPIDAEQKGPIARCSDSLSTVVVADTATAANFRRRELALEWGVGKITCVPLETGVLEFGTVTKDKRETTEGSEYIEATRQYRRSVYMHSEWIKHRSTEQFFDQISSIFESGVLRARYKEIQVVSAFAAFLFAWNIVAGGYTDFDMVKQPPLIPHLPVLQAPLSLFQLTAPTLGLLLVFKTNAAYGRWDNARKVWGSIINKTRSLVRQCNTFMGEDRYPGYGNFRDYRRRVAAETSGFTRCLRTFLRGKEDEENLRVELKGLGFTPEEVNGYMSRANRQVYALQKLGETIRSYGMDGRDRARMDQTLSDLCEDVGACERIFKTPIPLVYTRHTSRFVGLWLALLPLAIWNVDSSWNHMLSIPAVAIITFFLLGVEELGMQIEEPFGILPMEAFCDGSIGAALNEMVLAEDEKRKLEASLEDADPADAAAARAEADKRAAAEAKQIEALASAKVAKAAATDDDEKPGWIKNLVAGSRSN